MRSGSFIKRITRPSGRGANSTRNAVFSVVISCVTILVSFISRTIFIRCLSAEYLGLSSLLSNILTFLALADLGIESAFSFALYRPLRENDTAKVRDLMFVFRRCFLFVGIAVLALGAILTPFLPFLIKTMPEEIPLSSIRLYFLMYVCNTSVAYFFSYKRTLIICDQKEYLSTILGGIFRVICSLLQIVLLLATGSFFWYLAALIFCTAAENVTVFFLADRMYPFLRDRTCRELPSADKAVLRRNISAIFMHRVGGAFVFSSDSILISKFAGLTQAGLYANYLLITSTVNTILNKALSGMMASLGNLLAGSGDSYTEKVFYHILFLTDAVYGWAAVCLFCLLQPFIRLWAGAPYLLGMSTVIPAVISFYLTGSRMTVLLFKSASGIFLPDRYKALVESAVNIIASIPLAIRYGVPGVLCGTIISTLTVSYWFEALVFFRERYHKGIGRYLLAQAGYLAFNAAAAAACWFVCAAVPGDGAGAFLLKMLLAACLPVLFYLVVFRRSENMLYFRNKMKGILKK